MCTKDIWSMIWRHYIDHITYNVQSIASTVYNTVHCPTAQSRPGKQSTPNCNTYHMMEHLMQNYRVWQLMCMVIYFLNEIVYIYVCT